MNMYASINVNDKREMEVVTKALGVYKEKLVEQKRNAEIMENKKFKFGDVVFKAHTSRLDNMFGIKDNDIGVIVGHYDMDNLDGEGKDLFRVHFNDISNYVGVSADLLELYTGEVPPHLKNVTWNEVSYMAFHF